MSVSWIHRPRRPQASVAVVIRHVVLPLKLHLLYCLIARLWLTILVVHVRRLLNLLVSRKRVRIHSIGRIALVWHCLPTVRRMCTRHLRRPILVLRTHWHVRQVRQALGHRTHEEPLLRSLRGDIVMHRLRKIGKLRLKGSAAEISVMIKQKVRVDYFACVPGSPELLS